MEAFSKENPWLADYALFMAVKAHFGGVSWQEWPDEAIRMREPAAMEHYRALLHAEIAYIDFAQYLFFKQWHALKTYANAHGVKLLGDLPIYVAPDSADLWANPELFLVDVARRLFAQYGKSHVTMNDIAIASGKGRRTLYTYFRNKDEVYLAVIENELDLLIDRLQVVMAKELPADRKLEEYIFVRFEAVKEAVERNGSLKADFFRNIYEVEKARRPIDVKEIRMLKQIYDDGVQKKIFTVQNTQWAAMMTLYALKGLEAPYLNHTIGTYIRDHRQNIIKVLFGGIVRQ